MVSVAASDLKSILDMVSKPISDEILEQIIDLAIDCLNLNGADLPNMSGTAGSKTVSLESKQKAAVFIAARAIYYSFYRGIELLSMQNVSFSVPDLMSNSVVMGAIEKAAHKLAELEVTYG